MCTVIQLKKKKEKIIQELIEQEKIIQDNKKKIDEITRKINKYVFRQEKLMYEEKVLSDRLSQIELQIKKLKDDIERLEEYNNSLQQKFENLFILFLNKKREVKNQIENNLKKISEDNRNIILLNNQKEEINKNRKNKELYKRNYKIEYYKQQLCLAETKKKELNEKKEKTKLLINEVELEIAQKKIFEEKRKQEELDKKRNIIKFISIINEGVLAPKLKAEKEEVVRQNTMILFVQLLIKFREKVLKTDQGNLIESKEEKENNTEIQIDLNNEINFDSEEFDFLDDKEFDDLDTLLEDEKFIEEISCLVDVADKRYNLEYLADYHLNEHDKERQKKDLEQLVVANQKLVWKIVKQYQTFSTIALDEYDMYQVGMQGLIKAVKKFDSNKGTQFSTYAVWWIKQAITRAIADYSTTIRVPVHMYEKIIKYIKAENDFRNMNGRDVTEQELAEILNMPVEKVIEYRHYKNISNVGSLDTAVGDKEDSFLIDFIPDTSEETLEKQVENHLLSQEMETILAERLNERERMVLEKRFGFLNGKIYTLEEIGKEEHVTRERIRQIEEKALRKLKNSYHVKGLRDFYDED